MESFMSKLQTIRENWSKIIDRLRSDKQSFSDAALIYYQNPNATKVATLETWNKLGRLVNSRGFSCSAGMEKCGLFIFKFDKRIGRSYVAAEIAELLSTGRVTLKNCVSSNAKKYNVEFFIDDTGKFVKLRFERFD